MPRIIAGTARGRRIATPPGDGTRPTSDRVREALFGRLEHLDALGDARVLDLYAGSGALALEALSRGAAEALLVEAGRRATEVIRSNIDELGFDAEVRHAKVEQVLSGPAPHTMHLVLIDPPYAMVDDEITELLSMLVVRGWLEHEAVVLLERSTRSAPPVWPLGLHPLESREYGETALWFAEYLPQGAAEPQSAGA